MAAARRRAPPSEPLREVTVPVTKMPYTFLTSESTTQRSQAQLPESPGEPWSRSSCRPCRTRPRLVCETLCQGLAAHVDACTDASALKLTHGMRGWGMGTPASAIIQSPWRGRAQRGRVLGGHRPPPSHSAELCVTSWMLMPLNQRVARHWFCVSCQGHPGTAWCICFPELGTWGAEPNRGAV